MARRATRRLWQEGTSGLPPGLDANVLECVCRQRWGGSFTRPRYSHLSGWKAHGAYRVQMTLADGPGTVIFKNDVYTVEENPALEGLAVWPGPPEFAVYSGATLAFCRHLPEVYWARADEPGRRYRYLLEDLGSQPPTSVNDPLRRVFRALPAIHAAMRAWVDTAKPQGLIRYDGDFVERTASYIRGNLDHARAAVQSEALDALLAQWSRIEVTRNDPDLTHSRHHGPVHGDLNSTNIHFDAKNPDIIRLVDWEWAGVALPHFDLAALLKGAPADVEREAVELMATFHPQKSAMFHRRAYTWCKLERALLDAAFLGAIVVSPKRQIARLDLRTYIHRSAERGLAALAELS